MFRVLLSYCYATVELFLLAEFTPLPANQISLVPIYLQSPTRLSPDTLPATTTPSLPALRLATRPRLSHSCATCFVTFGSGIFCTGKLYTYIRTHIIYIYMRYIPQYCPTHFSFLSYLAADTLSTLLFSICLASSLLHLHIYIHIQLYLVCLEFFTCPPSLGLSATSWLAGASFCPPNHRSLPPVSICLSSIFVFGH